MTHMNPIHIQTDLRSLSHRDQIGTILNARGLVGKGVEIGTLYGGYSAEILARWGGHLYCVDPWVNQPKETYFDSANLLNMEEIYQSVVARFANNPHCSLLRMFSKDAVAKFQDGELDFVYLDGNHAVDAVREDIGLWWPKVKIGGIFSGHDCNMRYADDTNSDALTAVMELHEAIGVRPHITWCTSWWVIKTAELDARFRAARS